ncbi:MAG: hypothetical protein JWN71_5140 [Xanthobacteraceae bacterium]|jgi:GGDEF domain-containing protein|nr:hypothetical protein [Xanthobacteraceae bacterium]
MSLQGPILVVADGSAGDLAEVLRAHGAFPVIETPLAEAPAAVTSIQPSAVILAEGDVEIDPAAAQALVAAVEALPGPFLPLFCRPRQGALPILPDALPIGTRASPIGLVTRLGAAARVRTMHATVLRRAEMRQEAGAAPIEPPEGDPLGEASVLMTGRGRSYPALTVAVGERVAIIGALSVETAARYLNNRDIDGVVIGEGFGPRVVEALLTVIADDLRFRDLPVAVCGGPSTLIDEFATQMPNLEHVADVGAGSTDVLLARLLPLVRLHAFEARLKRMLAALDAEGMVDPDTGLLARDAFWRDLSNAVSDAETRGVGLSIARFAFEREVGPRLVTDAARLVGRLVRSVDFACREADNSIFAVFTETDLRAAHVITRRIASVLKHTMLTPDQSDNRVDPMVTLATLKSTDTLDTLVARVGGATLVAAS